MPPSTTDLKKFAQAARRSLREQVSSRLDQVLRTDSAALRERESARKELSQQIAETSKKAVIDRVAYTWFNRLCALRFMDANRYNRIGMVSPAEGFTQPEILQEAKQGYIDEDLLRFVDFQAVHDLLGGRRPSADPQQEAYRLLLVAKCNELNHAMPFLFEPIADYTELLMPQDLLSEHSILNDLRAALTPEACQDVEVIGWLYQFYISERKDEVFAALKQNQKIEAADIPAATQLFTPHWIVRYLVENSLGRLWLLNRPNSRLAERMDYYIRPEEPAADEHQPETDFLRVASAEEIKICDPACGSGHMLTYAFDLLYAIYEEEGYPASEIPRLILQNNLYGIEIDERAGALAAFALAMKARGRDRRFFSREVQPNICVLENITFTDQELQEYAAAMGQDLFTEPLLQTLKQFEQAKNFGSLIQPARTDTAFVRTELERKGIGANILLYRIHARVLQVLNQAEYLSPRYHVVVANPPYMGVSGTNDDLREYAQAYFPNSKSDLFAMFIERNLKLAGRDGLVGMITMQSWMFLSSYEKLRESMLKTADIAGMAHLGARAFDSIGGEVVSTTAFVLANHPQAAGKGAYLRLINGGSEAEKAAAALEAIANPDCGWFYRASANDFKKIPGSPIAYWVSEKVRDIFKNPHLENITISDGQNKTGDNQRFVRQFWEVDKKLVGMGKKWFFYAKGGGFRRWWGNIDDVVNWSDEARQHYKKDKICRIIPEYLWYKQGITWGLITSLKPSFRILPEDATFDVGGSSVFLKDNKDINYVLALLNTRFVLNLFEITNPTLNFQVRNIRDIPYIQVSKRKTIEENTSRLISLTRTDWNLSETSWEYESSPLRHSNNQNSFLRETYLMLREEWQKSTTEMQKLEQENNRLFVEAFGLHDEIPSDIPLEEITLTCNPHYRYGGKRSEAELEALLLADTMRELISYAVGCMFGRYSLDKPGLVLANQGETLQDYLKALASASVPEPTFLPDEDNAIPILDGDWFPDDITERFKKFLRVTFGPNHYEENLAFIEAAIGRDLRAYFLKEFYSQHVKMYQKRPIYWLFSSPRGSFNVLIYMHRYQPDTLSVILNRYLREFRGKLEGRKAHLEQISISASSTQREKTSALNEIVGLNKTLEEMRVYERDVLYPLAVQGIQIDLDDGVKINYKKFGKALARIAGLSEDK